MTAGLSARYLPSSLFACVCQTKLLRSAIGSMQGLGLLNAIKTPEAR